MGKFKLLHDRGNCIGCTACEAIAPDFWEMSEDGKSDIIDSKMREDGWEEKDINDEEYQDNKLAADGCPVKVIHIKNNETGEEII